VDDQDRSKFSLEDTRKTSLNAASSHGGSSVSLVGDGSRRSARNASRVEEMLQSKPPRPPEDGDAVMLVEDGEKEMKNSGAQGAILRKKKPKRRSTGVVQYNSDVRQFPSVLSYTVVVMLGLVI